MLAYVTIGTGDMDRAVAFYDALLAEIGVKRLFGMDRMQFYGTSTQAPMLAVCVPYDERPQHPGNGWMAAIPGGSREAVDRALELGASDEGAPGERIPNVFYGGYVRDPDGNKLCFMDMKLG